LPKAIADAYGPIAGRVQALNTWAQRIPNVNSSEVGLS
jgi:hypothetical protein